MRQFSRNLMYTYTALATLLLSGAGVILGSYKTVKLNVDGHVKEIHTFKNGTIADLLKTQGISVGEHDQVTPSLQKHLGPTETVWVDHARKVNIQDGGSPVQVVFSREDTVGSLLQHLGIQVTDSDSVNVRLDSPLVDGQTVSIKRHSQGVTYSEETIPFQTERQPSSSMYKGDEKVLSPGVEGLAKITTITTYENGKVADTTTKREVVREVQNRIIQYGTMDRPVVLASRSGDVFSSSGTLYMVATAYSAPGGRTALGYSAKRGVVAVDPHVIPLGTKLYIDGYGYAIAADTGGDIVGNRIDLCFDSNSDCLSFGRRAVSVHIVSN